MVGLGIVPCRCPKGVVVLWFILFFANLRALLSFPPLPNLKMSRDRTNCQLPRLLPSARLQVCKVGRCKFGIFDDGLCCSITLNTSPFVSSGQTAVRKNRYVILPADFEEAWKQTVKRTDETLEFCE